MSDFDHGLDLSHLTVWPPQPTTIAGIGLIALAIRGPDCAIVLVGTKGIRLAFGKLLEKRLRVSSTKRPSDSSFLMNSNLNMVRD